VDGWSDERTRFSKLFIVDVSSGSGNPLPLDDVCSNWSPHQRRIYWASRAASAIFRSSGRGSDAQQVTNDASVDWSVWDLVAASSIFPVIAAEA
jgi:hypothetical protein